MGQTKIKIDTWWDAYLGVDLQGTFMPGGGLAVPGGDLVVPVNLELMSHFPKRRRFASKDRHPIGHICLASSYVGFASMTVLTYEMVRDWTPENHRIAPHAKFSLEELKLYLSIVKFQVLWPDHGIPDTEEAELHPAFKESDFAYVQVKGLDPTCDSYDPFRDNLRRPTGLGDVGRAYGVRRWILGGLAFDYCVGSGAEGAVEEGFEAVIVLDATRSVGFPVNSIADMYKRLALKDVQVVNRADLEF